MRVITKSVLLGTVSGEDEDCRLLAEHGLKWNAEGYSVYIALNGSTLPVKKECSPRRRRTTRDGDVSA